MAKFSNVLFAGSIFHAADKIQSRFAVAVITLTSRDLVYLFISRLVFLFEICICA